MIPLFDVQCGCGGVPGGAREALSGETLLEEMARVEIGRALVRLAPAAMLFDPIEANERLFALGTAGDRLVPCPLVLPNTAGDVGPEPVQVEAFISRGARAVALRPRSDAWSLAPWACDSLLHALEERRLPALCAMDEFTLEDAAALAGRFPALPIILIGVSYRAQRVLIPLLQAFPNTYLSLGANYTVHLGVEQLAAAAGAGRLLFGTGYPATGMMSAITNLLYAELSDEEMRLIGSGNLARLLEGVR